MRDNNIISYVAVPPANEVPVPNDGNTGLREIIAALLPYHPIVPAPSLRAIAVDLSQRDPKPRTIQIIGHGSPGLLGLGYYWNERYSDDDEGPFYLLDSNPYAYSVLQAFVHSPMQVVLAGCCVGSNDASQNIAGGSPLIFDLHNMWYCDVLAADDLVDASCFVEGHYVGPAQGYVQRRWRRHKGYARVTPVPVAGAQSQAPKLREARVVEAAALGQAAAILRSFVASSRPVSVHTALLNRYSEEVTLGSGLLAMNEISFKAMRDDAEVTAHLICNSEFLAVVHDGHTRYFRAPGPRVEMDARTLFSLSSPGVEIWNEIRKHVQQFRVRWDERARQSSPSSADPR